jgi:DNA-binding HxlR family transcriptional regulator
MQRTSFSDMACSLARSLDVVGEWWTPLIVRDVWLGRTRFDVIQENLEVSRKVLADRLETLVREGVLEKRLYHERPARYDYHLTDKGEELMEALLPLLSWGDRWAAREAGPPMLVRHELCGKTVEARVTCSCCGEPLRVGEVFLEPGPDARDDWGTRNLHLLPLVRESQLRRKRRRAARG